MTKNYKRLYSRRSDGGLQIWELELNGNKYRVTSGAVGAKQHTNEWTECQGKNMGRANATTPAEQAAAEADALWKKKYESGYREQESELDSTGIFEPMLAKKYEDYKDELDYPVFSQPKLDGCRMVGRANGLWTRSGKRWTTMPHVESALAGFFKQHPDVVLDGEAYADKLNKDFSRICSLIKRTKPSAAELIECAQYISYHVYDCKLPNAKETFAERSKFIADNLAGLPGIVIVDTHLATGKAQLDKLYEGYLIAGQEGQIVRVDGAYENKRSKLLLKRKEFDDGEYTILGMEEGTGNRAGTCGAMHFQNAAGKPFKSNVKGTWEFTEDLWLNRKKYMGKQATIRHFGFTPGDKIPRFPYVVTIRNGE
jgi:DNA ligase-1